MADTYYPIVDEEIDLADKYRVRVTIRDSTVMFKFDAQPTAEVIQEHAACYEADMYPPKTTEVSDASTDPQ